MSESTDRARPTKYANEAKREGKHEMPGSGDDKFMRDYIAGKNPHMSGDELCRGEGPEVEVLTTDPEKVHGKK